MHIALSFNEFSMINKAEVSAKAQMRLIAQCRYSSGIKRTVRISVIIRDQIPVASREATSFLSLLLVIFPLAVARYLNPK